MLDAFLQLSLIFVSSEPCDVCWGEDDASYYSSFNNKKNIYRLIMLSPLPNRPASSRHTASRSRGERKYVNHIFSLIISFFFRSRFGRAKNEFNNFECSISFTTPVRYHFHLDEIRVAGKQSGDVDTIQIV